MRILLKLLNPFIWCINVFNYSAQLHHDAEIYNATGVDHHAPYDFDNDWKYF